jgi:hypothetical protein
VTRKRGRTLRAIPGDPADSQGFPVLARDFCEWMGVRGYSPRTIENNHLGVAFGGCRGYRVGHERSAAFDDRLRGRR